MKLTRTEMRDCPACLVIAKEIAVDVDKPGPDLANEPITTGRVAYIEENLVRISFKLTIPKILPHPNQRVHHGSTHRSHQQNRIDPIPPSHSPQEPQLPDVASANLSGRVIGIYCRNTNHGTIDRILQQTTRL